MENTHSTTHSSTLATRNSAAISKYNRRVATSEGRRSSPSNASQHPNEFSSAFRTSAGLSQATETGSTALPAASANYSTTAAAATTAASKNKDSPLARWRNARVTSGERSSDAEKRKPAFSRNSDQLGRGTATRRDTAIITPVRSKTSDLDVDRSPVETTGVPASTNSSSTWAGHPATTLFNPEKTSVRAKGASATESSPDESCLLREVLSSTRCFISDELVPPDAPSPPKLRDTGHPSYSRTFEKDLSSLRTRSSRYDSDRTAGKTSGLQEKSDGRLEGQLHDKSPLGWRDGSSHGEQQQPVGLQRLSSYSSPNVSSQASTPRLGSNANSRIQGRAPEAMGLLQFLGAYQMPTKHTAVTVSSFEPGHGQQLISREFHSIPVTTQRFSRRSACRTSDKTKYHLLDDPNDTPVVLDDELSGLVNNLEEYQRRIERAAVTVMIERQRRRGY